MIVLSICFILNLHADGNSTHFFLLTRPPVLHAIVSAAWVKKHTPRDKKRASSNPRSATLSLY